MPQTSARTTCTNQTLSDQTYTRPHLDAFGVSSKDFYFEEGFCLSTQKSRCSSKLCNSRSFLADFGKLPISVVTSHDFNSVSASLHFLWSNILVIFNQLKWNFTCRWWGRIFLMILKPPELFRRFNEGCFSISPRGMIRELDLGFPRWRDWFCITTDLKKSRCVVCFFW